MEGLGNTHPLADGIHSVITLPSLHGAGGGKPKEPRPPVEAPDSLHSTAYARIDDVLSEGPIRGLVNGLKSIYFNGTPLENPDGTLNFHNVVVDSRLGTQDQDYITGFGTVESEVGVGVRLMFGSPWTQALNNTALDGVRIRISTPMLQQGDAKTGDTNGTAVGYKIEVATDGGAYVPVLPYASITGKTTSKYERSHRIDLPPATNGWLIRVTRTTPESSSNLIQNETYIESFTELIDAKLRYPNTAHVATIIDAKQFQSIPNRGFDTYGRIVQVPSNYNPETREYAGLWDGTFKPAWTDNPAWVFYDLITHPRYGLGHLVTPEMFNKWAAYKIGRYCDQMVPDGRGGMEPRFTCNLFLQVQEDAYKVISDMAGVFRGMAYYAAGSIQPVADMPEDPVFLYTPANVKDGRFIYNGSGLRARHTVALVSWNDQTDFGRSKVEYVEDLDGIARYGVNQTEVIAVGCTSRGQARRYGKMLLATERLETDVVNFAVGLEGTLAAPGQIIRIADPLRAGRRIGGRVASATTKTIVVDAMPTPVPVAGDQLSVIGTGGVLMQRAVSTVNTATRTITVTPAFDSAPVPDSMWAVESAGAVAKLYRVLTVGEETDGSGYTISALEHNPEKFDFVDLNDPIEGEDAPPITRPPAVGNLLVTGSVRLTEYESQLVLTADWIRPATAVEYEVQWRKGGGEWSPAQMQRETHWELPGAFPGEYVVKVTPFNARAQPGPATVSAPYLLADPATAPPAIGDIESDVEDAWEALQQEVTDRLAGDAAEAIARAAAIADEAAARAADLAAEASARADAIAAEAQERADAIAAEAALRAAADAAEASARASAIADEAAARVAALQDLSDNLWGTIDALSAQMADIMEADEHDPALAYPDVGDLVQSGGKLYRSLQPVPEGVAITDEAYWQYMGEYASLGEAVAATVARVNVLTTSVTALDGEIAAINTLVTDLQSGLADAEGNIAANAGLISALGTRVTEAEGLLEAVAEDITGLTAAIEGKADASALNALTVRVTETEDSLESVVQDVTDLEAVIPGLATVAALDTLTTRVTENEDGIEAVASDLTALTTVVDGKASAGAVSLLETRVTETEAGIESLSTDVTNLTTVVDGKASTGALNALETRVTENEGGIEAVSTDVANLTAVVDGKASTGALQALETRVTENEAGIEAVSTDLTNLTAIVDGKASTGAVTALETRVTETEAGLEAVSTDLTSLTAVVDGKASTGAVAALETRVTETEAGIEAVTTDLTSLTTVVDGKASIGALNTLTTRVDENADGIAAVASDVAALEAALPGLATVGALDALTARVTENEGDIEAVVEDITQLNTDLDGKASADALDALTVTVSQQGDDIAANVTDISTMRASIGRPTSVVRKGTFEDGTAGMWIDGEAVAVSDHPTLSHALRVQHSITAYEGTPPDAVPVTPGDIVDVAVDVNASASTGNPQVLVHWIRADNSDAGSSTVAAVSGGTVDWQLAVGGATPPAPEGAARARIGLRGGTSGYTFFNNVRATIRSAAEALIDARVTTVDTASVSRDEALSTRTGVIEARMPSGTGGLATEAQVTSVDSASVSRDDAISTRVGVVEARMPAGTGPLATNAQIITEQQARADAVSAVASDLSALSVDVGEQSASITQLSKVTGAVNAAIVLNPSFELDTEDSWDLAPNMFRATHPTAARTGTGYLNVTVGGSAYAVNKGRFRVEAGQQIRVWGWFNWLTEKPTHGLVQGGVRYYDEAGNFLTASPMAFTVPLASLTTTPTRYAGLSTVPANAAYAAVNILSTFTTPSTARVMVDDVGAEFVTEGETKFLASHSLALDVNGLITGWVLHNDGSTGAFDVRADRFSVTSPSGTSGLSWTNGALWNRRGAYSLITSDTLGENMLFYIGPTPSSPATAKRADALFYVDSNGTGYFAGRVLQGVIRTFASSTAVGYVVVVADPTSSNGKEVSVKAVLNRQSFQQYNGSTAKITPGSGLTRAKVSIQRRYGTGLYYVVAEQYVVGSMEWFSEPGAGAWVNHRISGEVLGTDVADTRERQYRVVVSEVTLQNHTVTNPGTTPAAVHNQYASIESME